MRTRRPRRPRPPRPPAHDERALDCRSRFRAPAARGGHSRWGWGPSAGEQRYRQDRHGRGVGHRDRRRADLPGHSVRRAAGWRSALEASATRCGVDRCARRIRVRPRVPADAIPEWVGLRSAHAAAQRRLPVAERLDAGQGRRPAAAARLGLDPRRRAHARVEHERCPRRCAARQEGRGRCLTQLSARGAGLSRAPRAHRGTTSQRDTGGSVESNIR